ncbi:MAG: hypothetical protein QE263_05985 [Vampirovibrionales bacterium]|nr:hypothetical protein [Vampirovibrionales bacterium]
MPDFASLYWGSNHTQGKTVGFTKEHWASYITELEKTKAKTNAAINGNGTIDNADEMADVFGIHKNVAAALWGRSPDIVKLLFDMDESANGTISLNEYENYVALVTKLHPHLGTALDENLTGWNNGYGKVVPYPTDCGDGTPCNIKVYAASLEDQLSYVNSGRKKGGVYSQIVWKQYKKSGNFEKGHLPLEAGYGDKPDQTANAAQSSTGKAWDASIKIDHAVIFYDPRRQDFINDAKLAKKALKAKNCGIKIELIAATSAAAYEKGLASQAAFVKAHTGKENVVIFNSSHGVTNLKKFVDAGVVKYNDKGDLQGQCGPSNGGITLTEGVLEAHLQEISAEVENGIVVMDTCGSGAYTK